MGLMLENISPRLMEPGMPHYQCPDKDPVLRMETIANAGRVKVPFTTGVLVGIGETNQEIVDSIVALASAASRDGAIQEVIVQNFRAKANTPMRMHAEPIPSWFARVIAVTRWFLGAEMNVQAPPNLTESFEIYLEAGINDWGGVSPLTIDWVNPEQPWPHLRGARRPHCRSRLPARSQTSRIRRVHQPGVDRPRSTSTGRGGAEQAFQSGWGRAMTVTFLRLRPAVQLTEEGAESRRREGTTIIETTDSRRGRRRSRRWAAASRTDPWN